MNGKTEQDAPLHIEEETENESVFFLTKEEYEALEKRLKRLNVSPQSETITDIRIETPEGNFKKKWLKPRFRKIVADGETRIELTIKKENSEDNAVPSPIDTLGSKKWGLTHPLTHIRYTTKEKRYSSNTEHTYHLNSKETRLISEAIQALEHNPTSWTDAGLLLGFFREKSWLFSDFLEIPETIKIQEIKSRQRNNYNYKNNSISLEAGSKWDYKIDIEWTDEKGILSIAHELRIIRFIWRSESALISHIINTSREDVQGILINNLMGLWNYSLLKKIFIRNIKQSIVSSKKTTTSFDKFIKTLTVNWTEEKNINEEKLRKFDRLYPIYHNCLVEEYTRRYNLNPKDTDIRGELLTRMSDIFLIFGEKINPVHLPTLFQMSEMELIPLQQISTQIVELSGKNPDLAILMKDQLRTSFIPTKSGKNYSTSLENYKWSLYQHYEEALYELFIIFWLYADDPTGEHGESYLIGCMDMAAKIRDDLDTLLHLGYISQEHINSLQSASHSYEGDSEKFFSEMIARVFTGHGEIDKKDTYTLLTNIIIEQQKNLQKTYTDNPLLRRKSEEFENLDPAKVDDQTLKRMTHRALLSFFMKKMITYRDDQQIQSLDPSYYWPESLDDITEFCDLVYIRHYNHLYSSSGVFREETWKQFQELKKNISHISRDDLMEKYTNDLYLLISWYQYSLVLKNTNKGMHTHNWAIHALANTLIGKLEKDNMKKITFGSRKLNTTTNNPKKSFDWWRHAYLHGVVNLEDDSFQYTKPDGSKHGFMHSHNLYISPDRYICTDRAEKSHMREKIHEWENNGTSQGISESVLDNAIYIKNVALETVGSILANEKLWDSQQEYLNILKQHGFFDADGRPYRDKLWNLRRFLKFVYREMGDVGILEKNAIEDLWKIEDILIDKTENDEKLGKHQSEKVHIRKTLIKYFQEYIIQLKWEHIDAINGSILEIGKKKLLIELGKPKKITRIFEKYFWKYRWRGSYQLSDLTRWRLISGTLQESMDAIECFILFANSEKSVHSISIEDNTGNLLEKPKKWTGYRDITITLQMKSGNNVEFQFVCNDLHEMKNTGIALNSPYMGSLTRNADTKIIDIMESSIGWKINNEGYSIIAEALWQINQGKENQEYVRLPKELQRLFVIHSEEPQDPENIFSKQEHTPLSADTLYDLHRNLTEGPLKQKLQRMESILYEYATGQLVKKEYASMNDHYEPAS